MKTILTLSAAALLCACGSMPAAPLEREAVYLAVPERMPEAQPERDPCPPLPVLAPGAGRAQLALHTQRIIDLYVLCAERKVP